MNINAISPNLMFQAKPKPLKLTPVSEYKGPTLELTPENQAAIEVLTKELELWKTRFIQAHERTRGTILKGELKEPFYQKRDCEKNIQKCLKEIEKIKKARFAEQKAEYLASLKKLNKLI